MTVTLAKFRRLSVTKILLIGYFIIIAVGAVLLALPVSVKEGRLIRITFLRKMKLL